MVGHVGARLLVDLADATRLTSGFTRKKTFGYRPLLCILDNTGEAQAGAAA